MRPVVLERQLPSSTKECFTDRSQERGEVDVGGNVVWHQTEGVLIYSVGSWLLCDDLETKAVTHIKAHSGAVTCLSLSPSGRACYRRKGGQ